MTAEPIEIHDVVSEAIRRGVEIPEDVGIRWGIVDRIASGLVECHGSFAEDRLALDMVRVWLDMMERRVKEAEKEMIEGTGKEIPVGTLQEPGTLWEGGK